jgi:integral membrane sensor domain MASE1
MASWLQAAGLAAITIGVGFIFWPAGLIVGGIALVLAGVALAGER